MGIKFDKYFVKGNQTAQVSLAIGLLVLSIIRFVNTDRARRSRLDTWLIAVVSALYLLSEPFPLHPSTLDL